MTFGGDVMLGRDIERKIFNGTNPFEQVRPLLQVSEAVVVNLESPLTTSADQQDKEIALKARPQSVALLQEAGVTAAALANNHIMDFGVLGLGETIAELDGAGIAHIGAGMDLNQATAPLFFTGDGARIAVVNFSQYDGPTVPAATMHSPGQASYSSDAFVPTLEYAAANSDYMICVLHFGEEYSDQPTDEQRRVARQAIDHGADAVVGHHPHVAQGIDVYNNKPIFYSLGNLVFDQETDMWDQSFLLSVDLETETARFTLYPYRIDEGVPTFMSAERAQEFLQRLNEISPMPVVSVDGVSGSMTMPRP